MPGMYELDYRLWQDWNQEGLYERQVFMRLKTLG